MAPAFRGGRKSCCKACPALFKNKSETASEQALDTDANDAVASGFSTPKAKRCRIPDRLSCPPAPKKQRIANRSTPASSSSSSSISFFISPDLELFFLRALHEISL